MSLFDDDLFGARPKSVGAGTSFVVNEGFIPGWSVILGNRLLGQGLTEQTALSLCAQHVGSEIWGYGRTVQANWPNAEMKSACLIRNDAGTLRKTAEYPRG